MNRTDICQVSLSGTLFQWCSWEVHALDLIILFLWSSKNLLLIKKMFLPPKPFSTNICLMVYIKERKERKWSHSVVSDSVAYEAPPSILDSPAKNTRVGCHFLFQVYINSWVVTERLGKEKSRCSFLFRNFQSIWGNWTRAYT